MYASNAYTSAILPEYNDSIIPLRGICDKIVTPKSLHLVSQTLMFYTGMAESVGNLFLKQMEVSSLEAQEAHFVPTQIAGTT